MFNVVRSYDSGAAFIGQVSVQTVTLKSSKNETTILRVFELYCKNKLMSNSLALRK